MLKVLSLFSGIGAFEKALENLGIKHEVFDNDLCGTLRTINSGGDKRIIEADKIQYRGGEVA